MLTKKLIQRVENLFSEKVITTKQLLGGDINDVYCLETNTRKAVIKINTSFRFPGMFKAEAQGLEVLRKADAFTVPKVLQSGIHDEYAFLILEYIASERDAANLWNVFGRQLAVLHSRSASYFGFENDNYIGSLPQYNTKQDTASEFYIVQRLEPQFKLAIANGFVFENLDSFYKTIAKEIPNEPSSLIHGDLWNGNFIIDCKGNPCLIDPAISYAPREMDIAMMHLFGGFDQELFKVYNETFPLTEYWEERIPLWQLYYLLVHLNLFGSSYYNQVTSIFNHYK
ncbi:fructosamine kinase family protein [Aquimarina sp. 2201CG14-23]|uniref:fructosamine kinase family protein n=1 Tax=Aquimarina mycalae TaxID=3040073 RepID=UPI00247819B1|nr:fructosamine kinase family protein [Aquimarina sp. 2201CG14-23]MDH7445261.1 fructosamine kinase family protein [Aquimarina sp. 2201CG14-23]